MTILPQEAITEKQIVEYMRRENGARGYYYQLTGWDVLEDGRIQFVNRKNIPQLTVNRLEIVSRTGGVR